MTALYGGERLECNRMRLCAQARVTGWQLQACIPSVVYCCVVWVTASGVNQGLMVIGLSPYTNAGSGG